LLITVAIVLLTKYEMPVAIHIINHAMYRDVHSPVQNVQEGSSPALQPFSDILQTFKHNFR
jgi:hypothetical protein